MAQHADYSNFGGTVEDFARKVEILKGHCLKVGRDESEIRKTTSGEILIRDTEKELREFQIASGRGDNFEQWSNANFVGKPQQVADRIGQFVEQGCSGFIPWCVDYPDKQTLTEFAKIMGTYRN